MEQAAVLVHGLWMTGLEMVPLAWRLRRCGFTTHTFRYPSVRRSPRENAAALDAFLKTLPEPVIHLVAHSLGGIVVLHLFHVFPHQKPGRVVMLGTPLKGSAAAGRLARTPWGRAILGRSVEQGLLGGAPRWHGARDLGIIAGTRPLGVGALVALGRLPRPNDGTVELAATRCDGASEHLVMRHSHFGMLYARDVTDAVCRFLHHGRFAGEAGR